MIVKLDDLVYEQRNFRRLENACQGHGRLKKLLLLIRFDVYCVVLPNNSILYIRMYPFPPEIVWVRASIRVFLRIYESLCIRITCLHLYNLVVVGDLIYIYVKASFFFFFLMNVSTLCYSISFKTTIDRGTEKNSFPNFPDICLCAALLYCCWCIQSIELPVTLL